MYVASPYTDPVIAPDSDPQPLDAGDGLIWVVGPVLAVVFIICIVIAILLYKKWVEHKLYNTKCQKPKQRDERLLVSSDYDTLKV